MTPPTNIRRGKTIYHYVGSYFLTKRSAQSFARQQTAQSGFRYIVVKDRTRPGKWLVYHEWDWK